jgi:hypothetical protein
MCVCVWRCDVCVCVCMKCVCVCIVRNVCTLHINVYLNAILMCMCIVCDEVVKYCVCETSARKTPEHQLS